MAAESREDHEKTKAAMGEIDGLPFEEVQDKVEAMMTDLIEHMEKEETGDLVKVQKLDEDKLMDAGKEFDKCKVLAPPGGKKLKYKTPFELVSAPHEIIKGIVFGDEEETGDDSGYNLRNRDGHADKEKGKGIEKQYEIIREVNEYFHRK